MTAYELRISDWSSDVCSSDLGIGDRADDIAATVAIEIDRGAHEGAGHELGLAEGAGPGPDEGVGRDMAFLARKSVVLGKSVSVREDRGGRGIINKQKSHSVLFIAS